MRARDMGVLLFAVRQGLSGSLRFLIMAARSGSSVLPEDMGSASGLHKSDGQRLHRRTWPPMCGSIDNPGSLPGGSRLSLPPSIHALVTAGNALGGIGRSPVPTPGAKLAATPGRQRTAGQCGRFRSLSQTGAFNCSATCPAPVMGRMVGFIACPSMITMGPVPDGWNLADRRTGGQASVFSFIGFRPLRSGLVTTMMPGLAARMLSRRGSAFCFCCNRVVTVRPLLHEAGRIVLAARTGIGGWRGTGKPKDMESFLSVAVQYSKVGTATVSSLAWHWPLRAQAGPDLGQKAVATILSLPHDPQYFRPSALDKS
jgi:hypothetical protein